MGFKPRRVRIDALRAFYAEELRLANGLPQSSVEAAFATVPRERFVGPAPWRLGMRRVTRRRMPLMTAEPRQLYHDVLVGLSRNRNNGQPSLWYRLFQVVSPQLGEHVVHIGSGTGYYTAILAKLVGSTGTVTAFEVNRRLGQRARDNLASYKNVEVVIGDGARALDRADVIVVSAGVALPPRSWFDALSVGGRLVMPITGTRGYGPAIAFTREHHRVAAEFVMMVGFSPCLGTRDKRAETAIDRALNRGRPDRIDTARLDRHRRERECWLHTKTVCLRLPS